MSDLARFYEAQEYSYKDALQEIKNGKKTSCWMWYIFPQIIGLGHSNMAQYYSINSFKEAVDYLNDVTLGGRLNEICEALLKIESSDAHKIFGWPDDQKLKSSMTLFAQAAPGNPIFEKVLEKFFHGERDVHTLEILKEMEEQE